ncbi:hypothetical protein FNF29_00594 [Cafeteria roenbergensis]|uniref:PNPLA domain-containing protein n=1 Tax=Cafeteria roenbergensis TaxID=33653 RepID=A0A5A8CVP8_CAFRO|nr:hypothetical protein FNF29_00594 [Cafeteria roenbergensis]|eukprot:KAA0157242.1 hypothetical protein FNF29_00594 [Cafeteria roenbergensis]
MVLSLRIGRRAVSAARVASWMLLYSIGLAQRPRLREVGAGSSALTAFVLRSAWLAIAGLKNIVGADRWLTQLTAISVFQIASWAIRTTLAARPELAIMNRSISLPLLASVGVPAFPGWGESAARAADLQLAMRRCQTFAEYRRLAIALDRVTGMDAWRERDDAAPCGLLDSTELRRRISRYGRLERRQDARGLMWALRAELHRRPAGTGSPQLYGMAASGTKLVVEEHAHAAASALDFVCDSCPPEELVSRLAFFQETRHALGRTALLLSGGATNGIYHLGVIRALRDVHLLPPIVSGASAGSIVASLLGCKTDEELRPILHDGRFDTRFFQVIDPRLHMPAAAGGAPASPASSNGAPATAASRAAAAAASASSFASALGWLWSAATMYNETRAVFDTSFLANTLRGELGDMTFGEAFRRTGRVINIPVAPHRDCDFPRLLNYLTAPHVVVWSASVASCAIPGVFQPVELMAKDDTGRIRPYTSAGQRWTDGSVELDLPMQRLSELFNVNLFIVSQVNPHAMLLAVEGPTGRSSPLAHLLRFLKRQSRSFLTAIAELGHGLGMPSLAARGVLPFLTQAYEGDLTLMPPLGPEDFAKLLENPSQERVRAAILTGQRMTWPHIPWVRVHCLIEATLEACVRRLRRRLRVAGSSAPHAAPHLLVAGQPHAGRGFGAPSSVGSRGPSAAGGLALAASAAPAALPHTAPAVAMSATPAPDTAHVQQGPSNPFGAPPALSGVASPGDMPPVLGAGPVGTTAQPARSGLHACASEGGGAAPDMDGPAGSAADDESADAGPGFDTPDRDVATMYEQALLSPADRAAAEAALNPDSWIKASTPMEGVAGLAAPVADRATSAPLHAAAEVAPVGPAGATASPVHEEAASAPFLDRRRPLAGTSAGGSARTSPAHKATSPSSGFAGWRRCGSEARLALLHELAEDDGPTSPFGSSRHSRARRSPGRRSLPPVAQAEELGEPAADPVSASLRAVGLAPSSLAPPPTRSALDAPPSQGRVSSSSRVRFAGVGPDQL